MRTLSRLLIPVSFVLACLAGCETDSSQNLPAASGTPYVVAVNNPLFYFARRLVGDRVDIRLPLPPDIDPASWQPTAEDVLLLQGAELILLNGAGYSPWLDKVSLSSRKLVKTSEGLREQWIALDQQVTHSHGPKGEHAHAGWAFTTWMDISIAILQAEAAADALQKRWPEHSTHIINQLQSLRLDLEALDRGYEEQARRLAGRQLIYSHPVYPYFERRYGLQGDSLHWEPGEMPSEAQWQEISGRMTDNTLFIWEAKPIEAIAEKMQGLAIDYRIVNPAANRSDEDWLTVQRSNVDRLSGK